MKNGFKISSYKTKCMHLCKIHKIDIQPILKLNCIEIAITHQQKFLGITLDSKQSFILTSKNWESNATNLCKWKS